MPKIMVLIIFNNKKLNSFNKNNRFFLITNLFTVYYIKKNYFFNSFVALNWIFH